MLCFLQLTTLTSAAQEDVNAIHDQLSDLLKADQVSRITIIHVPSYIETRTRIDRDGLRALSRVEVTFKKPTDGKLLESLRMALNELKTAKTTTQHEVRWGLLLIDNTGKERSGVFLDITGHFLEVDGTYLLVEGRTLTWIRQNIEEALK